LEAERLLIAEGGRPHRPEIPGAHLCWVSDAMFELEATPEQEVVLGAGLITCEFACILNGLGLQVTQLVRGDHLLRGFDREASEAVRAGMEADCITIRPCGGVLLAIGRRPWQPPPVVPSPAWCHYGWSHLIRL